MIELSHYITNKALQNIEQVMKSQDYKGYDKYGTELNPQDAYDWDKMMDEELADYLKYQMCERMEKKRAIGFLEAALEVDNHKYIREYIQDAIKILSRKG